MKHNYANGRGTPFSIPIENSNYLSIYNRKQGLATLLICLFSFHFVCFAQESRESGATGIGEVKPLIVGQKVPEEFWNREHLFYINGDTVRKNLEEYKGKLLVLDFWATWCAICIYDMKINNNLFEKYKENIDFLLVNPLSTKDSINDIDRISKHKFESELTSIFLDTYITSKFPIYAYPTYAIIDKNGNFNTKTITISKEFLMQAMGLKTNLHTNILAQ